jgi:3-hydroxyacyl-CoA dehydrogenase, C-terminal domain
VTPNVEAIVERARRFAAEQLGKEPIVAPDRAGFTVNALLIPYLLSAIRMFEQGLASADDIDKGMVKGCAHPLGPLALADLIGLDCSRVRAWPSGRPVDLRRNQRAAGRRRATVGPGGEWKPLPATRTPTE